MRKRDARSKHEIRFTSAARKAKALETLGVSADELSQIPAITPFLKDNRGSLTAVLEAMRFSHDPQVQFFLAKRDSLGVWARANTSLEAVAVAAGVDIPHLLGAALMAARDHCVTLGNLTATMAYPDIIEKRIEYAMLPGGWRDREFIHKLVGFPPIYG